MPPRKKTPEKGAEKTPPLARAKMGAKVTPAAEGITGATLQDKFLEKLKGSKLDSKDLIKVLALEPMDSNGCRKLGLGVVAAGFKIPYWNIDGTPSEFFRFRYLEDPRSGFARQVGKMRRYGQLSGTENEVYLPPLLNWKSIANDISQMVWITEGELKSACGCSLGVPVIGLGGVWTWRAGKNLVDLLPQLKSFKWAGREVAICYDSDAATNPKVMAAEDALSSKLTELGALPRIVRLPPNGAQKVGMDDFLLDHDTEDLQALFNEAEEYKRARALHQMSMEVCYIKDPGLIMVRESGQLMSPGAFTDHQYANRFHLVLNGEKAVKVPTAAAWLRWEHRAEVMRQTYAPGKASIFRAENGDMQVNSWKGWGCEAAPGDVDLWHQLMDHIFAGKPDDRKWFEQWLAFPIQNPGAKMATAAVIWGREQGTGKSLIGYAMRKIYGENWVEINSQDLMGEFTGWSKDRQFVMGEEITGGEGISARRVADRMKGYISRQLCKINIKNVPEYFVPDCTNYYFTSNHPDCFFLEDSDRRFFVHRAPTIPLPDEWYAKFARYFELRPEFATAEQVGPRALRDYFQTMDLSGFNPSAKAPVTHAKEVMIMDGQSDVGAWIRRALRSPETYLRANGVPSPFCIYTPQQLLNLYDVAGSGRVSVNGFSRELRKAGVTCLGEWQVFGGTYELWLMRNRPAPMDHHWGRAYDDERARVTAGRSKFSPAAKAVELQPSVPKSKATKAVTPKQAAAKRK